MLRKTIRFTVLMLAAAWPASAESGLYVNRDAKVNAINRGNAIEAQKARALEDQTRQQRWSR